MKDSYLTVIKNHFKETLFKNSYYLMGNTAILSLVGFVFWVVAARYYPAGDIGYASAIISVIGFLSVFSLMGLDVTLIKYMPEEIEKADLINSCFNITIIIAIISSLFYIVGIDIWSPSLKILLKNNVISLSFVIFTIFATLSTLQISIFLAFRKAKYSFYQSILNVFRILLLPILLIFGSLGIYLSFGIIYITTFILGNFFIIKAYSKYKFNFTIKINIIKKILNYSIGNYIIAILVNIPTYLLPVLIVNMLSPESAAYFFISWTFAGILKTIPSAISRSLLAEGSFNPENLFNDVKKSLKFVFILLLPIIVGIILFGNFLLSIFGAEYANNAYNVLVIFSISSIPFSITQIYTSIKRVEGKIYSLIVVFLILSVITMVGSYLIIDGYGLIGIGYIWFLANSIAAMISICDLKRGDSI